MTYRNLDATTAFSQLITLEALDVSKALTKERIEQALIDAGSSVTYSWAAMPVDESHIEVLQALSDEQQLIQKYHRLLSGEIMNTSENRQVLHHLCRGRVLGESQQVSVDQEEKGAFYQQQLHLIQQFSDDVRSQSIVGSTGKAFTSVVQIGIGGSDLGPRALYLALRGWAEGNNIDQLDAHFISNVDPDDPFDIIDQVDLETTLFILVTKSGTTQETLTNYSVAKQAMEAASLDPSKHMVVVTSKQSPLATSTDFLRSFYIDDYIGGRYSATSAVGAVVLSLAYGFTTFEELLSGAHQSDVAALEPDIRKNAPLFDALVGVYLRNVLHLPTTAVLPYSHALSRFAAHLQQLDMESNGKRVNRDQEVISYQTGPIIFGEPGTNGQHSFYQLLHQGTDTIPLQFIGFTNSQRKRDITTDNSTSQEKLIANLVAQIVAFARGKDDKEPNKQFPGNRYSSLLFAQELTPSVLGTLLAHYENKVMFQGFIWNINSFDQEGVQLGKLLADAVLKGAQGDEVLQAFHTLLT
ncbi:MAG: glucose-6-phosphate isomerase [Sphaerochaetaceae bacterium]|jgi:glucose-6-phosphate isomerase